MEAQSHPLMPAENLGDTSSLMPDYPKPENNRSTNDRTAPPSAYGTSSSNNCAGNEGDNDKDDSHDDHSLTRPLQRPHKWQPSLLSPKKANIKEPKQDDQSMPLLQLNKRGKPTPQSSSDQTDAPPPREMINTFNVGGTIFETYRSTLRKLPTSPLSDEIFLHKHYKADRQQYFFDRDPDVFGAILNYLRTGELHLPIKYCGPAVKTELEFWGVGEDEIEECCWTKYSAWTTTLEALRKLERDRKVNMPRSVEQLDEGARAEENSLSTLKQLQIKGWALLNSPRSSLPAQIYSYVSLIFVVVSIFSFIAQTHPYFRVASDDGQEVTNQQSNGTENITQANTGNNTEDRSDSHPAMLCVDAVCLLFFILEFLLRILFSPRKCKLFLLPMTVFELLALLPDLIEFGWRIFNQTLGATMEAVDVITFLRLLRVFRIFRLMRHFPGLWILFYTLKASIKELLLLLLFLCVGMLFFASIIYYTDDRKTFTSIPMACWWSIVTMTTVGYGDMAPSTSWGYVVGSMTAVCGVLVIGFTVPVLVNNFILYYQHTQCAINRENAKRTRAEIRQTMKRYATSEEDSYKPFVSQKLKEATTFQENSFEKHCEESGVGEGRTDHC